MAGFDILALAVVGLGAIFGLVKGFFHQLLKVAVLAGVFVVLYFFLPDMSGFLSERLGVPPGTADYVVVLGTFVIMFIVFSLLIYRARKPIGRVRFGGLDRLAGGVLGALKGAGIMAVLAYALMCFPGEKIRADYFKRYIFKDSWAAPRTVIAMGYIRPAFQQRFFADAEQMMKMEPADTPSDDAALGRSFPFGLHHFGNDTRSQVAQKEKTGQGQAQPAFLLPACITSEIMSEKRGRERRS